MFVLGGADNDTVVARYQVHRTPVHSCTNYPLRQRHTAVAPPQSQYLTLHRTYLQSRPQPGCVNPVGDHHGVNALAGIIEAPHRSGPRHTQPGALLLQRLDQPAVIDGQFVDGSEPVPDALCQKRFDIPRGVGHGDRMALFGKPVSDRAEVGGVGAVDGDHQ